MNIPLLFIQSDNEHLDYFHYFTIINKAGINMHKYACTSIYFV